MLRQPCDVCGRPAKYHETRLDGEQTLERHLCAHHARKLQLGVVKDVLAAELEQLPADWLTDTAAAARRRISQASSLEEIAGELRVDERNLGAPESESP